MKAEMLIQIVGQEFFIDQVIFQLWKQNGNGSLVLLESRSSRQTIAVLLHWNKK